MTFISTNLLLDLPLTAPEEGKWRDESGNDHHADENTNCTVDFLPRLGACLKLESGGQLALTNPINGIENQLTVEFWAMPGNDQKDQLRQILAGPIAVGMSSKSLYFEFRGAKGAVDLTDTELHHWAITADRPDENSAYTVVMFRDGIKILPIFSFSEFTQSNSDNLIIGSINNGWTGNLAHLRIWNTILTPAELTKNIQRDITPNAAFKASTGIEWSLLNSNDEPSLYIQSGRQQELRISVQNLTGKDLIIPGDEQASIEWHFSLGFRPGTLAKNKLSDVYLRKIEIANPGWGLTYQNEDQQDCLRFLWQSPSGKEIKDLTPEVLKHIENKKIAPGESLTVVLPDVAAEPGPGSRSTQVMLQYQGLKQIKDENNTVFLDGHRSQLLNIIFRDPLIPYRKPPIEVGVVGAPVILNNGTPTSLTLFIKNAKRNEDGAPAPIILGSSSDVENDKKPKFILEIDVYGNDPDNPDNPDDADKAIGLAGEDDLGNIITRDNSPIDIGNKNVIGGIIRIEMPIAQKITRPITSLADLVGEYHLTYEPQNDWHTGWISLDGENLKWTNQAGVSWRLIPDLKPDFDNIILSTDDSNPYQNDGPRDFKFKYDDLDKSYGFIFHDDEFYKRKQTLDAYLGLDANQIVLINLDGIKTSAPPGRSMLRLRYEDFDVYGEGVFEIPIDKVAAIPAKLKSGGAGYGLALGHDPRIAGDPNAETLDQVLSVKQVGNGGAVRIENSGTGAGLTIEQSGSEARALFVKGSFEEAKGVEFRRNDETQGIGFGYNTIYATGSDSYQDLNLKAMGAGAVKVKGQLKVEGRISDQAGEVMPAGAIVMWSGDATKIPKGWFLCDGNNDTPNLKDRFIMGRTEDKPVDQQKGEADTHNHTVAGYTRPNGGHQHRLVGGWVSMLIQQGLSGWGAPKSYVVNYDRVFGDNKAWTEEGGQHNHFIDIPTTYTSTNTGNRPKWYALCFIMKK